MASEEKSPENAQSVAIGRVGDWSRKVRAKGPDIETRRFTELLLSRFMLLLIADVFALQPCGHV